MINKSRLKQTWFTILAIVVALNVSNLQADKIPLRKLTIDRKPKLHPYVSLLNNQPPTELQKDRDITNNRLLVILVDFQEETTDDPLTTGNGKFILTADSTYKTAIGSPPHNKEYFEANLDALRYYYLAASQGTFNLDYDVYPTNQPAYTLPNTMSYYNPAGATSELFVSRIEEYFKTSFELADSLDPEIDFSQYAHFMIIHAGSDWQHDYFGDTPSDLPSFFIRVGEGKEAVVDNGNVLISYACNVPSTISQDFDTYETGGDVYYTGYGALNGVMAHEFGHSLGLVDLYNVYTYAPMVGQFDIMDSGGSSVTEDGNNPGVLVEGQLPALPGAFSRLIMFGDTFKKNGLFVELNETLNLHDLNSLIRISASSQKQSSTNPVPNLVKIPLNADEYILIENRSVDPDGDGGTVIKGALDGRVAWYPTPADDPDDPPTYEYDYLLPSFIDIEGRAVGGGILVWHVDEKVLYQQGHTASDGSFVSNFDYNTVNYSYARRGVRVIEADGLEDIGNVYSWFWTGTPYEYFHTFKPMLDSNGMFEHWSNELWKPVLNAETNPALLDYQKQPAFYGLKDISQPEAVMTFKLTAGFFDEIYPLGESDTLQVSLPVINSPVAMEVLPVWKGNYLHFFLHDEFQLILKWTELIDSLFVGPLEFDFEPTTSDLNNDTYTELVIPRANSLMVIDFGGDYPVVNTYLKEGKPFTCTPMFAGGKLFAATEDSIVVLTPGNANPFTPINIPGGATKLAATTYRAFALSPVDWNLVIQQTNSLLVVDPATYEIKESFDLPENFTLYEPIINRFGLYQEFQYFLMSDAGNVYKCFDDIVTSIFHSPQSIKLPTNLALTSMQNYTYSPSILFARDNRLYAIKQDGSLLPGYPVYLENFTAKPLSHLKVRRYNSYVPQNTYEIIYLKSEDGGYRAVNSDGNINRLNCFYDLRNDDSDRTFFSFGMQLFWFFNDSHDRLLAARFNPYQDIPVLLWSGYRNDGTGQADFWIAEPEPTSEEFTAFIFPSPVKADWATLRLENPEGTVTVKIYDISGKLLYKNDYATELVSYKDIQLNVSKFSSGVYIAVVENGGRTKRIKFAKEM
ncbi:MAG: T9SS type A sorting domain-containing protein [Candidatus Cloacimonadaceae bacterium]